MSKKRKARTLPDFIWRLLAHEHGGVIPDEVSHLEIPRLATWYFDDNSEKTRQQVREALRVIRVRVNYRKSRGV